MTYQVVIEKVTKDEKIQRDRGPRIVTRCFPPVVQYLTEVDPAVQNNLSALAWQGHRQNRSIKEICSGLVTLAKAMGYAAAIGVQEVCSESMPSYPGQKIMTALIMVDLRAVSVEGARFNRAS